MTFEAKGRSIVFTPFYLFYHISLLLLLRYTLLFIPKFERQMPIKCAAIRKMTLLIPLSSSDF
ncbi:hypothetical protein SBF1_820016 [Candidatus Desulfosporosinus infrequens]|uniref:Uncharacterized protein n=1 Tax=Candidatus Desulfosporosinus infrequens TaxID=2043169 RepID=A0A2U3LU88_9FIRM|nr:hypothetical protein SBF1_820016 [Candidatus Desulfosporosinus infrequens]